MLNWLKRLTGIDAGIPFNLSVSLVGLIRDDLKRLDKLDKGLGARAIRFVVDDEDEQVLLALAGRQGGGKALKLSCVVYLGFAKSSVDPRHKLIKRLPKDDPALLLRLARVYEAASRREQRQAEYPIANAPDWLDIFLQEVVSGRYYGNCHDTEITNLPALTLEQMLEADGANRDLIVRSVLLTDPRNNYGVHALRSLKGLADAIGRHPHVVHESFAAAAPVRARALKTLAEFKIDPQPYLQPLIDLAVGDAKTVRRAADPLIRQLGDRARPLLRDRAELGVGSERNHAVRLVWHLEGSAARGFLEERREKDKSKTVRQTIDKLLAAPAVEQHAAAPVAPFRIELPPVSPPQRDAPLPAEFRDAIRQVFEQWNDQERKRCVSLRKQSLTYASKPDLFDPPADAAWVWEQLQSLVAPKLKRCETQLHRLGWGEPKLMRKLVERPELELIHFVRLLYLTCQVKLPTDRMFEIGHHVDQYARNYRNTHSPPFDLRQLAAAFVTVRLDPDMIGRQRLQSGRWQRAFCWEDEAVWPYFAQNLSLIEKVLIAGNPALNREPQYDI